MDIRKILWGAGRWLFLLFLLFFLLAGLGVGGAVLPYLQLGPMISSLRLGGILLPVCGVIVLLLLLTLLFGRIYCSFLCPLGCMQELFTLPFAGRKGKLSTAFRVFSGGFLWGLLLAGVTWGFRALDPFTLFYRGISNGKFFYILPIIFFLLVLWKGRIFCNSVCPVGGLLGLLSRFALYPLQIGKNCIGCGKCVKKCPAGSITGEGKDKKIDPTSCLLCLACVKPCPVNAISFRKKPSASPAEPQTAPPPEAAADDSRRGLLKNGGLLLGGLLAGSACGVVGKGNEGIGRFFPAEGDDAIYPPGAISGKEFLKKCLSCQLCAASCPAKVIRSRKNGFGGVELSYEKGHCLYECHICMQVCPAGALKKLPLAEKKRLQVGLVNFDPRKCFVLQESVDCGKCADTCPAGGITLRKMRTGLSIPRVVPEKCLGCGKCISVCPGEALTVRGVGIQKLLTGSTKP